MLAFGAWAGENSWVAPRFRAVTRDQQFLLPPDVREWLPVLVDALGAKPPRHFPVWLARVFAGEAGVMLGTESRGASNEKAKRELGWSLRYPTWRSGFFEAYAERAAA